MKCKAGLMLLALTAAMTCASSASADEKIKYTYDAKGRLVKVERLPASTVNTNVQSCYKYDKADNRVNVTVTATSPLPNCPN